MRFLLALGLLAIIPVRAVAQAPDSLDATLESVVTDGRWEANGREGPYRIVVYTGGFEHVVSEIYLQWLTDPTGDDDSQVIVRSTAIDSIAQGVWHLRAPVIRCRPACTATVVGYHMNGRDHRTWTITLGPPGQYSVRSR